VNEIRHTPVLLQEAVDLLAPHPGGVYLDGTLGAGGHAEEILRRSAPDSVLIGLDQDAEAVDRCRIRLLPYGNRVILRQANFKDMAEILAELGCEAVDGVLLDLGVSWFHLRTAERGFSFLLDGPLDMRMDQRGQQTAADLVNTLSRDELAKILYEYGEERKAGAIARAIEQARTRESITKTVQLANIVARVFPSSWPRHMHPATRTFQALRIAVNKELESLEEGLQHGIHILKPGGRFSVITFHSLEDRIVKRAFAEAVQRCVCPPKLPVCSCNKKQELILVTRKAVKPSPEEVQDNPAARSAKLRVAEKVKNAMRAESA